MNLSLIPAQRLIPSQLIEIVLALRCCLLLTRPLSCHFQCSLQQSTCLYVNCLSSLNWTEEKNEFFKIIPVFFKASAFLLTLSERKNRLLIHDMIQYLHKVWFWKLWNLLQLLRSRDFLAKTANWPPLQFFPGALGLVFVYIDSSLLGLLRMHNHNFLFAFLHKTQFSMIIPHIL